MRPLPKNAAWVSLAAVLALCSACSSSGYGSVGMSQTDERFGETLREGKQAQTIPPQERGDPSGVGEAELTPRFESYVKGQAGSRARADQLRPQQGSSIGSSGGSSAAQ